MKANLVILLCVCSVVASCYDPDKKAKKIEIVPVEFPLPRLINADEIDKLINACDKNETEMPVSQELKDQAIVMEGQVKRQDVDIVDCKETKSYPKSMVQDLKLDLDIVPPADLKGPVTFASVSNQRTCTGRRLFKHSDDEILAIEKNPPPPGQDGSNGYMNEAGQIKVHIGAKPFIFSSHLVVRNGPNVIDVTYYGECTKWRDDKKPKVPSNCQDGQVVGKKTFLLTMKIKTEVIPEKKVENRCGKKT